MVDLELTKKYLRIDGTDDDDLVSFFIDQAEEDLHESGVDDRLSETKNYQMAVMIKVANKYENRQMNLDSSASGSPTPDSYQDLLLKLKAASLVLPEDGDTT